MQIWVVYNGALWRTFFVYFGKKTTKVFIFIIQKAAYFYDFRLFVNFKALKTTKITNHENK